MQEIKIAVVGNVDSGKSTIIGRIVKAIKGIDENIQLHHVTDSLTCEKDNNKTISSSEHTVDYKEIKFIFLNCPGHKEYVKDTISRMLEADLIINVSENVNEESYISNHVKKISRAKNNRYINIFNLRNYNNYENVIDEYSLSMKLNILKINDSMVENYILESILFLYNLNKITIFKNKESYAITVSQNDFAIIDKKGNKYFLTTDDANSNIEIAEGIFLKLLKITPEPKEELIQIIKDNKNNIDTIAIAMIDKNRNF